MNGFGKLWNVFLLAPGNSGEHFAKLQSGYSGRALEEHPNPSLRPFIRFHRCHIFSFEDNFSSLVARALSSLDTSSARALRGVGWWAHVLVFLGFAAYLPTTKHMHLVFAWPNVWLFRRQHYGLPPRIDFEKTEKFGIDRVQELPWKSLLDAYACTECGRCNAACPAHATGKPLMPMKVLHDVKVNLRDSNGADILRPRDPRGRPLADKVAEEDAYEPKTPLVSKLEIDRARVRPDGGYLQVDGQGRCRRVPWSKEDNPSGKNEETRDQTSHS